MKMMPRKDLILMLQEGMDCEILSEDIVEIIFKNYGDDYFKADMNFYSDWELCNKNEKRKQFLKEAKSNDSNRTNRETKDISTECGDNNREY